MVDSVVSMQTNANRFGFQQKSDTCVVVGIEHDTFNRSTSATDS